MGACGRPDTHLPILKVPCCLFLRNYILLSQMFAQPSALRQIAEAFFRCLFCKGSSWIQKATVTVPYQLSRGMNPSRLRSPFKSQGWANQEPISIVVFEGIAPKDLSNWYAPRGEEVVLYLELLLSSFHQSVERNSPTRRNIF